MRVDKHAASSSLSARRNSVRADIYAVRISYRLRKLPAISITFFTGTTLSSDVPDKRWRISDVDRPRAERSFHQLVYSSELHIVKIRRPAYKKAGVTAQHPPRRFSRKAYLLLCYLVFHGSDIPQCPPAKSDSKSSDRYQIGIRRIYFIARGVDKRLWMSGFSESVSRTNRNIVMDTQALSPPSRQTAQ